MCKLDSGQRLIFPFSNSSLWAFFFFFLSYLFRVVLIVFFFFFDQAVRHKGYIWEGVKVWGLSASSSCAHGVGQRYFSVISFSWLASLYTFFFFSSSCSLLFQSKCPAAGKIKLVFVCVIFFYVYVCDYIALHLPIPLVFLVQP